MSDPVSVLEVTFPDEWLILSVRSVAAIARPVPPGGAWAHRRGPVTGRCPPELLQAVSGLDFDGIASLALPGERTGDRIQAFCAIGVVPATGRDDDELRAVAESGRHAGLERDTLSVEFPVGPAVRSSAYRFADELLDDRDVAPFAAEVRFALRLPGRRIGVLHFETFSLSGFGQLEPLFDTIAGTARVA
jgi:hypothetical protein